MKQVKRIVIKKKDLLKNIVLKRALTRKHLKYIGEYKAGEKLFKGSIDLDISTYHQNIENLHYIDNFAKEEIAKQIIKEINGI
jgi:hypothetical protein